MDRWLWAIRLFRTRTASGAACKGGHVSVNGQKAKPATSVRVGDTVEARVGDRDRRVEVVRLIEQRVGAPIAVECYTDHSPPPPSREHWIGMDGIRDRGTGRPTKKDRREMERLRGKNRQR